MDHPSWVSQRELSAREREVTLQVLHHLRKVERRRLFAELGYSSLFVYCVEELEYSSGSAQRRIASMRLLKELPEIEEKITEGSLNLSLVSRAQSFFKQEAVRSVESKREVLSALVGKSDREAERELASRATTPAAIQPARTRAITEQVSEIRFAAENQFLEEIDELRALLAHAHPGMSIAEALQYGVKLALGKHRPKTPAAKPVEKSAKTISLPAPEGTPRRTPTAKTKYPGRWAARRRPAISGSVVGPTISWPRFRRSGPLRWPSSCERTPLKHLAFSRESGRESGHPPEHP